MAINQNHLFEDLNGVKCAIVEKNVAAERVDFLRQILEYNRYTVVVVPSPPPKAPPAVPAAAPSAPLSPAAAPSPSSPAATIPSPVPPPPAAPSPPPPPATAPAAPPPPVTAPTPPPPPATFTVGVTEVMFNPVNAIFGRLLKTPDGHIVTLAYWQQQEKVPDNENPYFDRG